MNTKFSRSSLATWALVLMLFDHLAFLVEPFLPPWLGLLLRVPGRFSMPAFAFMTASAAVDLELVHLARYVRRLGLLAVVSEAPYFFLFHEHVNAVFPLWLGALVVLECRRARALQHFPDSWGIPAFFLGCYVFALLGAPGEALYAIMVVFLAIGGLPGLAGAFGAALLVNWPASMFGVATVGMLALILWGQLPALPQLPQRFRYAFYPLHMLVLAVCFLSWRVLV